MTKSGGGKVPAAALLRKIQPLSLAGAAVFEGALVSYSAVSLSLGSDSQDRAVGVQENVLGRASEEKFSYR